MSSSFAPFWRTTARCFRRAWPPAVILVIGLSPAGLLLALSAPFLYRPLPYDMSGLLVVPRQTYKDGVGSTLTGAAFRRLRERSDLFDLTCGYRYAPELRVLTDSSRVALKAVTITPSLLECIGTDRATEGTYLAADDRSLVLSHAAAIRVFGASKDPVGRMVRLQGGGSLVVRAVLPEGQLVPVSRVRPDALVVTPNREWLASSDNVDAICRRKPGVTVAQLNAALAADPEFADPRFIVRVVDLRSALGARMRSLAMWSAATAALFFGLSVFSACGLMGIKSIARQQAFFIQRAIGATDRCLARGVLIEMLSTAALAAGVSLTFAWAILQCMRPFVPPELLELGDLELDATTVSAMALLSLLGACTAYLPYIHVLRHPPTGQGIGEHRSARRLRRVMIAAQGVLAMLFVGVASLLLKSQMAMFTQDTGLSLRSTVVTVSYPDDERREAVESGVRETLERFGAIPGVRAAAAAQGVMFDDWSMDTVVRRPGASRALPARLKYVRGAYVQASGGRVISGREPSVSHGGGMSEVLVNRALAARLWPETAGTGESIVVMGRSAPSVVAGVLADAFEIGLDEEPPPTVYIYSGKDLAQRLPVHFLIDGPQLSDHDAAQVVGATAGGPAVLEVSTVGRRLAQTVRVKSFAALLCAVVAAIALLTAWVGVAVVVGHTVSRRRRELAIRMAIGATPSRLVLMVTSEVVACTSIGIGIGVVGAVASARIARSFVYQAGDTHWLLQIAVAATVVVSVVGLSVLRARRASRVQPGRLLNSE